MIIRHCAPTLAGIKTGNIFCCDYNTKEELWVFLRGSNQKLVKKGLRVLPLRLENGRAMIYVHGTATRLLNERNYTTHSTDRCVLELMAQLKRNAEFPHEIGLFLGYPPEDVDGFIENGAANSKYTGLWKVYGNVDAAIKTFAKYKKCTDVYSTHYAKGSSIERLTLAETRH